LPDVFGVNIYLAFATFWRFSSLVEKLQSFCSVN